MLDTENKRRSILGLKPAADLLLDSLDRIQFLGWFAAILPRLEIFFFWRKHDMNQTDWEQENVLADPFTQAKDAGSTDWAPNSGNPESFTPDKKAKTEDWVPVLDFPEV